MALLPIAAVFVGVLYIEISDSVIGKIGVGATIARIWKKYWRALLIIAVPFLAAFVYFAAFGLIRNVYDQAYLLNTKVYATYTGGFGGNCLNTIVSPFQNYFSQLLSSLNALFTNPFWTFEHSAQLRGKHHFVIGLFKWRKSYGVIMALHYFDGCKRVHGLPLHSLLGGLHHDGSDHGRTLDQGTPAMEVVFDQTIRLYLQCRFLDRDTVYDHVYQHFAHT